MITRYKSGSQLVGLIYMHRLTDRRFTGIAGRNFRIFRELCGETSLKNVVLVTNMWNEVSRYVGEAREKELASDFLKPALDKGAKMVRHHNTEQSAHDVLRHIINNHPVVLQIQRELVNEHKDITNTSAGAAINADLAEERKRHEAELKRVEEEKARVLRQKEEERRQKVQEEERKRQEELRRAREKQERVALQRRQEMERAQEEARMERQRIAEEHHQVALLSEFLAAETEERQRIAEEHHQVALLSEFLAAEAEERQRIAEEHHQVALLNEFLAAEAEERQRTAEEHHQVAPPNELLAAEAAAAEAARGRMQQQIAEFATALLQIFAQDDDGDGSDSGDCVVM